MRDSRAAPHTRIYKRGRFFEVCAIASRDDGWIVRCVDSTLFAGGDGWVRASMYTADDVLIASASDDQRIGAADLLEAARGGIGCRGIEASD